MGYSQLGRAIGLALGCLATNQNLGITFCWAPYNSVITVIHNSVINMMLIVSMAPNVRCDGVALSAHVSPSVPEPPDAKINPKPLNPRRTASPKGGDVFTLCHQCHTSKKQKSARALVKWFITHQRSRRDVSWPMDSGSDVRLVQNLCRRPSHQGVTRKEQ